MLPNHTTYRQTLGDVMIEELVKDKNIKSFLYRNGEKMIDVADVATDCLA